MYGYVRVGEGELKTREYELYRAFYCGLCREMGRTTGFSSRVSLSYDAAFLAIVRCAVVGESISVSRRRCFVHPTRKRPAVESNETLASVACASAILARAKLDDVRADERGASRFAAALGSPWARRWSRRGEKRLAGLEERVQHHLSRLSELEAERRASVDDAAGIFGELLGEVAAFDVDGDEGRLLREIGELTGRFIYVCDACDDAAEDARRGRYNPLVEIYGSELCERRSVVDLRGRSLERDVLRPEIADEIQSAAMMLLVRLDRAVDLIDFTKTPQLEGIIRNVVQIGLPGQLRRVLGRLHTTKEPDETDGGTNKEDGKR